MKNRSTWFKAMCVFILLGFIVNKINGQESTLRCPAQDFLTLHQEGRIKCNFTVTFTKIFWYKGYAQNSLIHLLREDSNKLGPSAALEEFDIADDGSLIIKNVTLEHEITYGVLVIWNGGSAKVYIRVSVIVPSLEKHPIIQMCKTNDCHLCVPHIGQQAYRLRCCMTGKPLHLNLYNRILGSQLESQTLNSSDVPPFNNCVEAVLDMTKTVIMELMCIPSGRAVAHISENASVLLIKESEGNDFHKAYFELNGSLQLGDETNHNGIWIKQTMGSDCHAIVTTTDGRIYITSSGQLVIHACSVSDAGIYTFIYKSDETYQREIYDVKKVLPPETKNSYIEGCQSPDHCVRTIQLEHGTLTCKLPAVRPVATIKWTTCKDQTGVEFPNGEIQPARKLDEDIYEVSQILHYRFTKIFSCNLTCTISSKWFKATHISRVTLKYVGKDEV